MDFVRDHSPNDEYKLAHEQYRGFVLFHRTPSVHFDVDVFRAEAAWFLGEKQVIWVYNSGMIYNW